MTQPTRGSGPPRGGAPEAAITETLETLNDHLARLFQHADGLLAEWKAYGEAVRGSLDGQVTRLHDALADATARAAADAAERVSREMGERLAVELQRSLADSVAAIRREIEALAEQARAAGARSAGEGAVADGADADSRRAGRVRGGGTSARRRRGRSPLGLAALLALLTANAMLAALLVLGARDCRSGDGQVPAAIQPLPLAPVDAGVSGNRTASAGDGGAGDGGAPDAGLADMCAALAAGWDDAQAGAFAEASARALCPDAEDAVADTVRERLGASAQDDKGKGGAAGKGGDARGEDGKRGGAKRRGDRGKSRDGGKGSK